MGFKDHKPLQDKALPVVAAPEAVESKKNHPLHELEVMAQAKQLFRGEIIMDKPPGEDPRPELSEDSALWSTLLEIAFKVDPVKLHGKLHFLRAAGTRIKPGQKGYVLRPDIAGPGGNGWESMQEYEEVKREWLMEHKGQIAKLLSQLPWSPAS